MTSAVQSVRISLGKKAKVEDKKVAKLPCAGCLAQLRSKVDSRGKIVIDEDKAYTLRALDGHKYFFCSQHCYYRSCEES
jgi:hypothetical protein